MARWGDPEVQAVIEGRKSVENVMVGLPGADLRVGVRVLSEDEIDGAGLEAQRFLETRVKGVGRDVKTTIEIDPSMLDRLRDRELVFRAFVDPDDHAQPFFPTPSVVRELDSGLMDALVSVYLENQESKSPRGRLTDEEVDQLVEALGKEPLARGVLAHFEPALLRSCVRSLAARLLEISPTGKSSTGLSSPEST